MVGVVKVLLDNVWLPVVVTTLLSIDIVPLDVIVPPDNPVPAVIEVTVPLPDGESKLNVT